MRKQELYRICKLFRDILEKEKDGVPVTLAPLNNFPYSCCGVVSRALAIYLCSVGVSAKVILGEKPNTSHAWVEVGQYILDITADQFDEISEKIIVKEKSKCVIHATFTEKGSNPGEEMLERAKEYQWDQELWILEQVNRTQKEKEAGE